MKRRSFINSSIAGTLGVVGLSSFNSIPLFGQQNIKITITPWTLMRTGYGQKDPLGIDVFDYPAVAKSLGFDYIDHEMFHFPPNLKEEQLQRMLDNMKSAGVKSAVMLTGGVGDIGDANPVIRKKAIETYKYWVDVAATLGCKAMRNVCGEFITIPHEEKLKYALEGVSELGTYAASKNLDLLIENHNGYSSDPEWMIALMEGINQKNVGVLGDFTNWTLERNPDTFYPDPYKGIELLAPYIRAVSAKSSDFTQEGKEVTTNYQKMFDILKKAPDFEFAGVEFFGEALSRNQGAIQTKRLIEKVL
ncbi:MAG: sugar phosphate isomerase/epimerase [Flavobacteriaceae bacterium]|jgi:sugar phosphate isomerase/epimerase|nr:sugar phosphate isomerase/epimerase [Flavobacteriaceae bacterium]MDG2503147.1 sugar phosphate isomerase/epimerase [Flavobacteriaceae bacterium]|tara:strand:+ start:1824 stop:2738 length:915 start_codon:yes stop_codon:yes gene_type:complete